MVLNKTRKRRTRGSGKTPLRLEANEFIPSAPKPNAVENITEQFGSLNVRGEPAVGNLSNQLKQFVQNAVAIDCEMVGVGRESALAHVAIVDFNGNPIYDKYVIPRGGINSITNYRTRYSGITRGDLAVLDKVKHAFPRIKREVANILQNRMIVGHGLINDFKVLEFVPNPAFVWDTTQIDLFLQNDPYKPGRRPRKLKALAMEFAGNNIQKSNEGGHSPLEDARASMNLYRLSMGYPKVEYNNMSK